MSRIESVENIREEYIKALAENEEYFEVLKKLLDKGRDGPISSFRELSCEELPDFKNKERQLQEILLDLTSIHNGVVELAERIDNLVLDVEQSTTSALEVSGIDDTEVSGEEDSPAVGRILYIDQIEKRNYYKDKLVNEYLAKGRIIDKEKLDAMLENEDTKLSVFNEVFIEEGETLDTEKFNSQHQDLLNDLEILYRVLYKILDNRLVNIEEKVRCRLVELDNKVKEYKNKAFLENLGVKGNTLYFAANGFKQEYKDGRIIVDLGTIAIPSGSYIAAIFKSDEIEADKTVFKFDDDTQIKNYLQDKDYLKILGNYKISTKKYTLAGSTPSSFNLQIEPEPNSFYYIYLSENKIRVTYDGSGVVQYFGKVDRVPFRLGKDGLISFYVYDASYLYISTQGEASYKSFDGYEIESPKRRQKIEIKAEAGFEFDIATDGIIYADMQEARKENNKLICLIPHPEIEDYMVETIAYGEDVVFKNVEVIVESQNTTFLDIDYIAIKQRSISEIEGEAK